MNLFLIPTIIGVLALSACQSAGEIAKVNPLSKSTVPSIAFKNEKAISILAGDLPELDIQLEQSVRTEDCHRYLEPGGEVADPFPELPKRRGGNEPIERSAFLASCAPEAYHFSKNSLYVAYGFPTDIPNAQDLRILKYDLKSKALIWSFEMDRSENARNYIANYRGTFLTFVDPNKVCVGTLWAGGTQTLCIDDEKKAKLWSGRIPSWSAIKPVGANNGLFIAGLNSITKRYPFGGTEMSYLRLPGLGGRSAFYRSDGKSLYFSPSRSIDKPQLYRFDFEPLALKWTMELPEKVDANFGEIVNNVIIIHANTLLMGISTEGKFLWQYDLGDGRPSVSGQGEELWVLHRRKSLPNLLIKIDALSGKRIGQKELEPGSLKVLNVGKDVFVKGVRAVRKVQ